MKLVRIAPLPDDALAAAAVFYAEWYPQIRCDLEARAPLPFRGGAGGGDSRFTATFREAESPHPNPVSGWTAPGSPSSVRGTERPETPEGEGLILIFPPADHTHRAWRLAAVQGLARQLAPLRVNAVVSDNDAAIAESAAYLAAAPGLTGQYLPLDGTGAGAVIDSGQ